MIWLLPHFKKNYNNKNLLIYYDLLVYPFL